MADLVYHKLNQCFTHEKLLSGVVLAYPLHSAFSEFEFEDLESWEDTGGIVSLCHGVEQYSMEGNPTDITMWTLGLRKRIHCVH